MLQKIGVLRGLRQSGGCNLEFREVYFLLCLVKGMLHIYIENKLNPRDYVQLQ